ncbi:MAG TPA: PRC-barrel domain-containing protein [Candidatus Baltobacteraceae bacterium]|nr:PRC-barrel domain-containing protein [Candidatus Baltobacteraceae bacterium]
MAGVAPLAITVEQLHLVAVGYRATKIIGAPVYNERNENVGKVVDFVVTPKEYVSFVVVGVGGFLGIIGGKDVAIPASRFKGLNARIVLTGATKQALMALPPFIFAQ